VYKELAWIKADNLVCRHPAVGTADPEKFRRLLPLEAAEEIRIRSELSLCPAAIVLFQVVKHEYPSSQA
jgi:hypothetical protein